MTRNRIYQPSFFVKEILSQGAIIRITMNATDYADIRKTGRDVLDVEYDAALLRAGCMGRIYNVPLHVKRSGLLQRDHFILERIDNNLTIVYGWCANSKKNFITDCGNPECVLQKIFDT